MTLPRTPTLDRSTAAAGPLRIRPPTPEGETKFAAALARTADLGDRRALAERPSANAGNRPIPIEGERAPENGALRATSRNTHRDRRAVPPLAAEPDTLNGSAPTGKAHDGPEQQILCVPHRHPDQTVPHASGAQTATASDPSPSAVARSLGLMLAREEGGAATLAPPIDETPGGFSVSHRETQFPPTRFNITQSPQAKSTLHDRTPERLEPQVGMRSSSRGTVVRPPALPEGAAGPPAAVSSVLEPAPPPSTAVLEPPAAQVVAAIIDHCSTPYQAQSSGPPRALPTEVAINATQPLRLIRLQLSPATLGTVDIQLTMERDALRVQLEAASASTAVSLARDRTALVDQLISSGHLLADVQIGQTPPRASSETAHTQGTFDSASFNASAGGSEQTPHGGRNARGPHSPPPPNSGEVKTPDQRSSRARDGGSASSATSVYSEVRVLRMV